MAHGWAVTNLTTGLAATAFTWGTGATTNRGFLNDGRMDKAASATAASGGTTLTIDLGSSQNVSVIALLNSNIAQATNPTVTITADSSSGFGTATTVKASSSLVTSAPRHKDHAFQFGAFGRRYWRITWAWTGSFTLTLGEVFVGLNNQVSRHTIYGASEREAYVTSRFSGYTGRTHGHFIAGPFRTRRLPFADLDETEKGELMALFRAAKGGATPLLWCEQYEAAGTAAAAAYQNCIYGRLEEDELGWTEADFGLYEPDELVLRSLAREVGA